MPHGKHPADNILLSLAVLMAGASVSKVLLLDCAATRHIPSSHISGHSFSQLSSATGSCTGLALLGRLKDMKDMVWSGDGRFDSMGHSAKYGAYTMFSTSIMKVVHFELVQI